MITRLCRRRERTLDLVTMGQIEHIHNLDVVGNEDVIERIDERVVVLDARVVRKVWFLTIDAHVRALHLLLRLHIEWLSRVSGGHDRIPLVRLVEIARSDQRVPGVARLQVEVAHQHRRQSL